MVQICHAHHLLQTDIGFWLCVIGKILAPQVRGKGYRPSEGIEELVGLPPLAAEWARQPHNYDRLQAVLDAVPTGPDTLIMDTANLHNGSFSGGDPLLYAAVQQCRSRACVQANG